MRMGARNGVIHATRANLWTSRRQAPALLAPLARDPRGRGTSGTPQAQQQPAPRRLLLGLCFQVHFQRYQQRSRIVHSILSRPWAPKSSTSGSVV